MIKYILITGIIISLYITEPMWRIVPNNSVKEITAIEEKIKEQQDERNNLIANKAEKLRIFEEKFGKKPSVAYKSRVPKPLQEYWRKTLDATETIHEDICSLLKATDKGWETICQYKIKSRNGSSELMFNTYIIKDGVVIK